MNSLKVTDKNFDNKLSSITISATMTIRDYLALCEDRIKHSYYQRRLLPPSRNKVFKRLIEDLKDGCTIPAISLAILKDLNVSINSELQEFEELIKQSNSEEVTILDGIQRTNCLIQVRNELKDLELERFLNSKLRLEIWINIPMMSLLYRMVALNAGQTAMTLRHQLEILNTPLKTKLKEINSSLDLFEESKEVRKRVKPLQYQFADIVEAFMAFIQGDPEVDKQNEVAQRLERIEFLENHSSKLEESNSEINMFAFIIGELDQIICERYQTIRESIPEFSGAHAILGSVPTLTGICAAWGKGYQKYGLSYMNDINDRIIRFLSTEEDDPLSLALFAEIRSKSKSKRIGEFERRLVYRAFMEFIEEKDPSEFYSYWNTAIRREGD